MGHSRLLQMTPFGRSRTTSYSPYIVTMAVSVIVFEIKRDIGRKRPLFHNANFSYPLLFNLHDRLEPFDFFFQNVNTNCPNRLLGSANILPTSSFL